MTMKTLVLALMLVLASSLTAAAQVLRCEGGVGGPGWKFDMTVYVRDGVAVDQLITIRIDGEVMSTDTMFQPNLDVSKAGQPALGRMILEFTAPPEKGEAALVWLMMPEHVSAIDEFTAGVEGRPSVRPYEVVLKADGTELVRGTGLTVNAPADLVTSVPSMVSLVRGTNDVQMPAAGGAEETAAAVRAFNAVFAAREASVEIVAMPVRADEEPVVAGIFTLPADVRNSITGSLEGVLGEIREKFQDGGCPVDQ
jgi:hypothetical protein